jgi:hypothetical protein
MIKKLVVMVVAAAFILSVRGEESTVNLVRNGDFGIINSKGLPVGWSVSTTAKQEISEDKTDKPKGAKNSIKISIKNSHNKLQGCISQYIKGIEPNTEFILTGKLKCTMEKIAFLQIKLIKGKKELKRIDTGTATINWQTLSKEFSSGGADTIAVLCRFTQAQKAVGATVWFADIKLERKSK